MFRIPMNDQRPALLLVLLLLSAACRAPAVPGEPLRVMAYNIKHGRGMDGVVDLERAARVIEAARPDVVTLQEIDRGCGRSGGVDQAAWLGERLGMEAVFGAFMPHDGGEYGMAVLSRLPVLSSTNHRLPPGPEPRTALALRLRSERGEELVVVGVHLYASEEERHAQAAALLEVLADESAPVLIAGDLNSEPGGNVLGLLEGGFENVSKGADRLTFDSVRPSVEIDHVLLRPAGRFDGANLDVLDEPLASDHRPLVLDVRLLPGGIDSPDGRE